MALLLSGCSNSGPDSHLFTLLPPDSTGVHFVNEVKDKRDFNIINYLYFYDGGGVAVGDINNDGRPDLFFVSNMGKNHLYLNEGHFHFKDITDKAGVAGTPGGWSTGVTMADVNGDGWLDIYVCRVNYLDKTGANELFINNKDGTFTEEAKKYGLDFKGYSKQAVFFDYDRDGDLDMYLVNHSIHTPRSFEDIRARKLHDEKAGDRLYRNDGGHFTDVTTQAGIYNSPLGYGLSVTIGDYNDDGWPDIYVSNDFHENDYLYYNNGNGTFTENLESSMGHVSRAAMGDDSGDINNDGKPDIVVADMLPYKESALKRSAVPMPYDEAKMQREYGYYYQYTRNTLQLNRGVDPSGIALFSEIAPLAGVEATDWSWSPLLCDFNNDGWQDLFVTNGIQHRPNDKDYLHFMQHYSVSQDINGAISAQDMKLISLMPAAPLANHMFKNNGNLTFTDMSKAWGAGQKGFSNGAAYADLNNDGAVDLVVNNVNKPAYILRNNARKRTDNHYLSIKLDGKGKNTFGIGSKVYVYSGKHEFYRAEYVTRGFESSSDPVMHFGLGRIKTIDSLRIIWPNWDTQKLVHISDDTLLTLNQRDAHGKWNYTRPKINTVFREINPQKLGIDFEHKEDQFNDFKFEPLLPHKLSTEGPKIAVADVNHDGLQDFYVGGARGQAGVLYVQQKNGRFKKMNEPAFDADKDKEDIGALFFDANGDGSPDLYVVSGGNEFPGHAPQMEDRLYLNDGSGHFTRSKGMIPAIYTNGSCVKAADFDGDGDMDLFIGGRSVPRQYGVVPQSYLLRNDGKGHFTDVTNQVAPGLQHIGMVTDAVWTDYDHDGKPDLIVVGEWMPITVFHNEGGKLVNVTKQLGLDSTNGWWNTIAAGDFSGNGRIDFLAGNLGENSVLKTSKKRPVRLFLGDFDHNSIPDPVITYYLNGKQYPLAGRDQFLSQMPSLNSRFSTYAAYAGKDIQQIIPEKDLKSARKFSAYTFASCFIENMGNGKFRVRELPVRAQFSPVYAFLSGDFDHDGKNDVLLAGNFSGVRSLQGRYDAGYGLMLKQNKGNFKAVSLQKSGFIVKGDVRSMKILKEPEDTLVIIGKNNGRLQIFKY